MVDAVTARSTGHGADDHSGHHAGHDRDGQAQAPTSVRVSPSAVQNGSLGELRPQRPDGSRGRGQVVGGHEADVRQHLEYGDQAGESGQPAAGRRSDTAAPPDGARRNRWSVPAGPASAR